LAKDSILGIEIGGTKLQIVCGDSEGNIHSVHRFHVNKKDGAAGIRKTIEETIEEHYAGKLAAVGIGFGGPVNRFTGQIATSFHIEGWAQFPIVEWLQAIAGAPIFIDNDANAALGEATNGAGKSYHSVLYVTLGSGVGGGLVIDKKIYHGALPGEVEIGHIRMDKSGTILEDCCSGWSVDKKIRKALAEDPTGTLATLVGDKTSGEAVILKEAMAAKDKAALHIFDETTDDLAFGLSHAVHLLHPEVIILGGGLSLLGEELRHAIAQKLPRYLMKAFAPGPHVTLAALKEKAVPVGTLVLASQHIQNKK
jgi:glucokinase